MYRQAVAVNSPSAPAPTTPACGTFTPAEHDALIEAARRPEGEVMSPLWGGSGMTSAARKTVWSRRFAGLVLAAVTIPAAILAATVNSTAAGRPLFDPAHPVVDAAWIYAHDWEDANTFIYKVAGSDGCLPTATDCSTGGGTPGDSNNLPPNYNGAQEFYEWWKGLGTSDTPQPNGKLGRFVTARDHLFNTRSWQLNDAELTIPGGGCAGQQVMLASHNDSTPVSTNNGGQRGGERQRHADEHDALRQLGQRLGLRRQHGREHEPRGVGSVLRWHEANGTYPARTIKATLYDNEEGGLVGSGQYSAAGTPATLLQEATAAGATKLLVASTANLRRRQLWRSTSLRATPRTASCRPPVSAPAGDDARRRVRRRRHERQGDRPVHDVVGCDGGRGDEHQVRQRHEHPGEHEADDRHRRVGRDRDDHERRQHGWRRHGSDGHARARDRPRERLAHPHVRRVRRWRAGPDRGARPRRTPSGPPCRRSARRAPPAPGSRSPRR